ncbi:PleD family two-component system response regulator [Oceanomicrobium pacificus]|uniref:diguanylate cyclase n=1 Tax=Oceanomicrobium pacificus TaxID=2692916 RepID=A0A6B0TR54_9RHOB|nr:PleD family two-component system response regulator [Oceanomicrobium pacificus]MXU63844.1 PleD family two-component system response regulator [Oceanomicrobium pacificus]
MSGRILVVDDVSSNRSVLAAMLAKHYYEVETASGGRQALDLIRQRPPDLILLDVFMDDLSGFDVCRQLKADPDLAHIPVVMVTASDNPSERLEGLRAGADDFLGKPIDDTALFARVRSLTRMKMMVDELRMRASTARDLGLSDQAWSAAHAKLSSAKVLIAPGSQAEGQDLRAALVEALGCAVAVEAGDKSAIHAARADVPDLCIVSNRLADGSDGLKLVSALKGGPTTRGAGILLIIDPAERARATLGLELGVSDTVSRPLVPAELVARCRSQLRRKLYSDQLRMNLQDGLRLAVVDPLTGLHNRRYATEHLDAMAAATRQKGQMLAVMMLDLDRFKQVNDRHGHAGGDAVLKEFAGRLQENVRGVDLVARLGGEEFLLVLPDISEPDATQAAERIRAVVEEAPFHLPGGQRIRVTVSIGMAFLTPRSTECSEALISRADAALYASKHEGRNRITLADAAA